MLPSDALSLSLDVFDRHLVIVSLLVKKLLLVVLALCALIGILVVAWLYRRHHYGYQSSPVRQASTLAMRSIPCTLAIMAEP